MNSKNRNDESVLMPQVDGEWWDIAGNPDLGRYNSSRQQPLDFGIWQAVDETWQLWSCVRRTRCGGRNRLFFRWQGECLMDSDWKPMGIAMESDPNLGEYIGGLQSPFVYKHKGEYFLFYGDWVHICMAKSWDGKTFARILQADNYTGMFTEGHRSSSRDPMLIAFRDTFYLYYTGVPHGEGAIYCRTSKDLSHWGESKMVSYGGRGGKGPTAAECPFVIYLPDEHYFYLFRAHPTKETGEYETTMYRSPDPLDFGIDDDRYVIGTLPTEAARIIFHDRHYYIAALKSDYTGIRMARFKWVRRGTE